MRRGFSIVFILFFGLGPLSAMIPGSEDASLPACCRRHGAHHCAMASMLAQSVDLQAAFTVPQTCPNFPGLSFAILTPAHALAVVPAGLRAMQPDRRVSLSEQAAAFLTLNRTRAGRGPPTAKLT